MFICFNISYFVGVYFERLCVVVFVVLGLFALGVPSLCALGVPCAPVLPGPNGVIIPERH